MNKIISLVLFQCIGLAFSLVSPTMTRADEYRQGYDYVKLHQTSDPYQVAARKRVVNLLATLSTEVGVPRYDLIIARIPRADQGDLGAYFTSACSALAPPDIEPIILCNEDYFYEIEAMTRADEMASIYRFPPFRTDPTIFSFIQKIIPNPKSYALKMRSFAQKNPDPRIRDNEEHIREHIELALLFFAGHELGHLQRHHPHASLINVFSPNDKLEDQVDNAVVRMCRHAEEFSKARFGLKGYEWVQNLTNEINQSEHPQFRLSEKFAQRDELYRQETEADNTAVRLMLAYLLDAESQGIYFAAKQQFFLIETLHSLGVYSLYRDLTVLGKRICPGGSLTRTEELMKCLALNREQYVKASSIFSDFHRPVLWRTSDAMFAILESRKNHSGLSPKERTFAMSVSEEEELQAKGQVQKLDLRRRYAQNYQRAFLHSILIDTQVKLAMYTCALGLEREIERKFFFEFEGMQAARNRMELAVQGKGLP